MTELINQERTIKILLLTLLLITLILGSIIYKNYLNLKDNNKIITQQKEGIEYLNIEMHHRVKNNLAIIISILRMQARSIEDHKAIEALKNSEARIQAIFHAHEMLFKNENSETVNLGAFLESIIKSIQIQLNQTEIFVNFNNSLNESLILKQNKAIPLALMLNELMTNSYKYGKQNEKVEINIELLKNNQNYILLYSDNGPGFDEKLILNPGKSLGLKLIKLFTEQLKGSLEYKNKRFEFTFKQEFLTV